MLSCIVQQDRIHPHSIPGRLNIVAAIILPGSFAHADGLASNPGAPGSKDNADLTLLQCIEVSSQYGHLGFTVCELATPNNSHTSEYNYSLSTGIFIHHALQQFLLQQAFN